MDTEGDRLTGLEGTALVCDAWGVGGLVDDVDLDLRDSAATVDEVGTAGGDDGGIGA